ncbi:FAM20A (predicted) [Pycnogonum litorale]
MRQHHHPLCSIIYRRRWTLICCLILAIFILTLARVEIYSSTAEDGGLIFKCKQLLRFGVRDRKNLVAQSNGIETPPSRKNSVGSNIPVAHLSKMTRNGTIYKPIYVGDDEIKDVIKFAQETPLGQSRRNYKNMSTLASILELQKREKMSALRKFQLNIGQYDLYREDDPLIPEILKELRTLQIESSEQHQKGTQFKLIITFKNGGNALFKPMRFPREVGTWDNHYYFSDFERHYSEIASFHLDRILGFRRAVPVTGRYLNIRQDIMNKTSESVESTIFVSPADNLCIVGECKYYCVTGHAICGNPDKVEGSFAAYLAPFDDFPITRFYSPYRRSYSKRKKAKWEKNPYYCEEKVLTKSKYNSGRLLLDMIDMYIFDFLTGNMDRHHLEYFQLIEPEPYLIHLDHGRGFGRAHYDDMSILTPLIQCCYIRLSTLKTLVSLHLGPQKLSDKMRNALSDDPAAPVLLHNHLEAMDRRIKVILREVERCVEQKEGVDEVVTDDGF